MFLLNQRIIFLLTSINLAITKDLISLILLLNRLDLSFIHMIINCHLLLLEIDQHLGNLFLGTYSLVPLPLLDHLQYLDLVDVVVIIEVVLGCIDCIRFIFLEMNTSAYDLVISVFIVFCCFLANAFDTFDETVMITVWVVCDDTHTTVDLSHLLPVRQLPWAIELNRLEFIGITVTTF